MVRDPADVRARYQFWSPGAWAFGRKESTWVAELMPSHTHREEGVPHSVANLRQCRRNLLIETFLIGHLAEQIIGVDHNDLCAYETNEISET